MAGSVRIIPLGGLGEVGKNMTVVESDDGIVIIDSGIAFPRDEHLGIDLLLPELTYLREREDQIRAIILTHGHEDHVGALPYVLRDLHVPEVWATRLTLGLVKSKLDEHGLLRASELIEADPEGGDVQVGPFQVEFVRMAHSIPDAVAVCLETPAGRIVHTGDYKIDHTPVDGFHTDVGRLAEIGNRGVDLLLGDSTNAERPGVTPSERTVGEAFRQIIPRCEGRVLIASFASNVHRMQQAVDVALETGRKVAIIGRSLKKNMNIARNLGYMDVPEDLLVKPADLDQLAPEETMILCTGSQGEPLSALVRIAYGDHQNVDVRDGDTVIISAKPVPGNELKVHDTINRLAKAGADVLHQETSQVHASGHGNSEELRMVISLLRPKAVMPVHGEYRMLSAHGRLARDAGVAPERVVIAENGSVVELAAGRARIVDHVPAGVAFIDGLEIGDLKDAPLRDRRHLAEDGVLIVVATLSSESGLDVVAPEVVARGFSGGDDVLEEARDEAERILRKCLAERISELKLLQEHLHDGVGQLVHRRTGRRPMILPVVIEV
jgi:ribonuclease J